MKFKYEIKRTSLKDCTLLSGASAFVFKEDPDGKSFEDLISEIVETENLTEEALDLLLRKYVVSIELDSECSDEDVEDITDGLMLLDNKSLMVRAKMEKHKDPAVIALQRIVVCGCIRNIVDAGMIDILQKFNFITFDMSKYSIEELRKNTFVLGKALQQTANNVWIFNSETANSLNDDNQFDRSVIGRMETFSMYVDDAKTLENPFFRVLA